MTIASINTLKNTVSSSMSNSVFVYALINDPFLEWLSLHSILSI